MGLRIIELLVRLAILIMAGIIVPAFKRWLDTKAENEKFERIRQVAETAVYAAEQLMHNVDPDGTERYNFVVSAILATKDKIGINLTDDEIKTIIEAAVQELNVLKYGYLTDLEVDMIEGEAGETGEDE